MGGANNPVSNLKKSVNNLSKGRNVVQSGLSVATLGLIGSGEDAPDAPSFEDRLNNLEKAGAFGGMSLDQYQRQNQGRIDTGYGYSNEAAQAARDVLAGKTPSQAQILFNQGLDQNIAAANSAAQSAPVDSALAYRSAMDAFNQQQAQAVRNAALLRANEIAQARGELSNIGTNLQSLYSNNYNNAAGQAGGVQTSAAQIQNQNKLADYQTQQNQFNALIGAAGSGLTAGIAAGAFNSAAPGATPGTITDPNAASNKNMV
jgi:hypothetical protein